jgi:hypothetical protein
MLRKVFLLGLICSFLVLPVAALADSITPPSVTADLAVGESITVTKTVTVAEEPPTTAPVDVFFLTDSTGSMIPQIAAVKASASQILADTVGLGDLQWGAGEYRDIGDAFVYRTNQDLTSSQAAVQAGINAWNASGGGDFFEANLFALEQVATTVSWRDDATKILVWFGDAPGHDPRLGSTEASATAALVAENIAVQAVDVGSLDLTGQATRIAAATGGALYSGISTPDLVQTIIDAIVMELDEYTTVSLGVVGDSGPIAVSFDPAAYVGAFDRSVERTFDFDVTFERTGSGDASFQIGAFVDGGLVATEDDRFPDTAVPEPATMLLLGSGLLGLALFRRRT